MDNIVKSATASSSSQQKSKKRELKVVPIYSRSLLTKTINVSILMIGKNIRETIQEIISTNFEGKCLVEGYIKKGSTKIITYSSGLIERGTNISFEVVFECEICYPVEGMLISCVAQNITKAGIKAASADENPSPIVVFIARDHNYNNDQFTDVNVGDKFNVRVIGQRFELNDKYISIIAELVKPKTYKDGTPNKPKLVIGI
jgi:DNA-directed RNA polymerase subunit E'/Rpb7